jgi:hypothetical protein
MKLNEKKNAPTISKNSINREDNILNSFSLASELLGPSI